MYYKTSLFFSLAAYYSFIRCFLLIHSPKDIEHWKLSLLQQKSKEKNELLQVRKPNTKVAFVYLRMSQNNTTA